MHSAVRLQFSGGLTIDQYNDSMSRLVSMCQESPAVVDIVYALVQHKALCLSLRSSAIEHVLVDIVRLILTEGFVTKIERSKGN